LWETRVVVVIVPRSGESKVPGWMVRRRIVVGEVVGRGVNVKGAREDGSGVVVS
jgi:hypothetical protein